MDQNEQRSKRNGGVRLENSGKSTQTVKHVKLDLERPKLTKEGNADQGRKRPRSRKRSFDSSKKDRGATLKIIPLGGLDAIGKNMTVFECKGDMVLGRMPVSCFPTTIIPAWILSFRITPMCSSTPISCAAS